MRAAPAWRPAAVPALVTCAIAMAACSPAFDWRETRIENAPLAAMFPCKPDRQSRVVALAGHRAALRMAVCSTGGATFALGAIDMGDPAAVAPGLHALREAAAGNLADAVAERSTWAPPGATPNDEAARLALRGRLPDGAAVAEHAVFFARGATLYQASVIGAKPPAEAVETFFGGLRFVP